jgi:protein-L-isoaspartate O-methyltransferase
MLIPVGNREEQTLRVYTKRGDTLESRDIADVRFVPLIGRFGWPS